MKPNRTVMAFVIGGLLAFGIGLAHAQSAKAFRRPIRKTTRQAPQQPGFTFGDISIVAQEMKFVPGRSVVAEGPNVIVDSLDKETGTKSQLMARKITATMGKGFVVDRVEATGNVRFNATRHMAGGKGALVFNGSGSKATHFKQQGRLVIDGPVNYYAEQPVEGQAGKQWVRGTAAEAIYDEKGRTLTLTGSVKAKAFDPESMPPDRPADIIADKLVIDMTKQPYEYTLLNNDPISGKGVTVPIKQQPKKP